MITTAHILPQLAHVRAIGIMPYFYKAANATDLPVSLLLAVGSRESGLGTSRQLDANWRGDFGNGYGVMQIDRRYHPDFTGTYPPNAHEQNILYGANYLRTLLNRHNGKLDHALAAYNAGSGRVYEALQRGAHPDVFTTGGDYSKDVMHRANIIESTLNATRMRYYAIGAALLLTTLIMAKK